MPHVNAAGYKPNSRSGHEHLYTCPQMIMQGKQVEIAPDMKAEVNTNRVTKQHIS